ncbi:MAG: PAS domain S-box protein, partial [Planctomycetes bacterium]|nr:PAS domain S-box protein [Planctomycetota bacterium]
SVIEQSIDGIALTDEEGYIVEWNPGLEKITGINRNEAIGQLLWKLEASVLPDELRTPEIENTIESNMQKFLETGESPSGEQLADLIIRKPDGENRFVQISMFSIRTNKGFRGASVMRDVTEQKHAQESKKKSEELFSIAFESSLSAMGITTLQDGKYIIVNPAFTRIFGYEVEESIDHTSQELGIFTDYSDREVIKTELTRTGYVDGYELKTRTKLGERKETLFSAQVVEFQNEKCLLATGADITERKKSEEALRESEEKFNKVFRLLPDAAVITSMPDNRIIDANDTYVRNTGIKYEDVIGKYSEEMYSLDNPEDVETIRQVIAKDGRILDKEIRVTAINGERKVGLYSAEIILLQGARYLLAVTKDITERKQAEEALMESEAKLRTILESSPDAITMSDLETKIVDFNAATMAIHGFDNREELIGKNAFDLIKPEDHQKAMMNLQRTFTEDVERNIEFTLMRKDGTEFIGEMSSSVIRDTSGNPSAFIAVTKDITERKRAEEEMQKLASVVRYSSELVNISTLDGKMTFLNEAGQNMLGIDLDKVEQFQIMEVIPDHLVELVETELLPALTSGDTWEGELQYRNLKTGQITDVHAMTFPVKDSVTGEALYFANVSLDITERKQAEDALRESEEKYRTLFESASDAVFAFKVDSESIFVTDCNPRALSMFGYDDPVDLVGKSPAEFSPPLQSDGSHSRERVIALLDAAMAKGPQSFEWTNRRKDGTTFEAEVTVSRVEIGGETYLQSIVRDITERKQAEEKEREAEKLKEVDRLRAELLSNVSHELRTPLGSIMGYSSLILNYDNMLTSDE